MQRVCCASVHEHSTPPALCDACFDDAHKGRNPWFDEDCQGDCSVHTAHSKGSKLKPLLVTRLNSVMMCVQFQTMLPLLQPLPHKPLWTPDLPHLVLWITLHALLLHSISVTAHPAHSSSFVTVDLKLLGDTHPFCLLDTITRPSRNSPGTFSGNQQVTAESVTLPEFFKQ